MVALNSSDDSKRRKIRIVMPITVREFADATEIKSFKIIADLMELGIFASLNQRMTESSTLSVGEKNGIEIVVARPPET